MGTPNSFYSHLKDGGRVTCGEVGITTFFAWPPCGIMPGVITHFKKLLGIIFVIFTCLVLEFSQTNHFLSGLLYSFLLHCAFTTIRASIVVLPRGMVVSLIISLYLSNAQAFLNSFCPIALCTRPVYVLAYYSSLFHISFFRCGNVV